MAENSIPPPRDSGSPDSPRSPRLFQGANPPVARRQAQPDPLAQVRERKPPVALQLRQESFCHIVHARNIALDTGFPARLGSTFQASPDKLAPWIFLRFFCFRPPSFRWSAPLGPTFFRRLAGGVHRHRGGFRATAGIIRAIASTRCWWRQGSPPSSRRVAAAVRDHPLDRHQLSGLPGRRCGPPCAPAACKPSRERVKDQLYKAS